MNSNSNIQKMLNDELECFKEIHASSKLIADDLNEATNDTLVNLLIEREKRIKTIQLIENERKSLDISEQKLKCRRPPETAVERQWRSRRTT